MKKPVKILVPIDFSRYSLETLDFTLTLKDFCDPSFLLLHVVPSGEVDLHASLGKEPGEALQRRMDEAARRLADEAGSRISGSELQVETRVVAGTPFKEICRLADEASCKLIIIGTHGRTGLSHLLVGSTAERVVQHASCPVLTIKPKVL